MEKGKYSGDEVLVFKGWKSDSASEEIWEKYFTDYDGVEGETVLGFVVGDEFIVLEVITS